MTIPPILPGIEHNRKVFLAFSSELPDLSDCLRIVTIDRRRLDSVVDSWRTRTWTIPAWNQPFLLHDTPENRFDYLVLMNTLNFSFFADPGNAEWYVEFHGESNRGAFALFSAFTRALEEGRPVLDGEFLKTLSRRELAEIFRGSAEIPMLDQRLAILHEVGTILVERFDGRFHTLWHSCHNSAVDLAVHLASAFPSFRDEYQLDGYRLPFLKRAQLAAAMLFGSFAGTQYGEFNDIDRLTVFADYRLPQALHNLGILCYPPPLEDRVRNRCLIPAGSRSEIEIRLATVIASDLMIRRLRTEGIAVTAIELDMALWKYARGLGEHAASFHRTRTSDY